mgnify:CR=1 FL=1
MFNSIWMNFFYEPLYNSLVFLISHVPWSDVGIAVVALTVLVKIITFPLTQKSLKSQIKMREIEPELEKIKKDFPNKEEQAKKTFELYKTHKINPLSGCLVLIVQLPILIALYKVFYSGLVFDENLMYSFVHYPENLNTMFLGIIDIAKKSIPLALLAGITQFVQIRISMPAYKAKEGDTSFKGELMKSMNMQMRYVMPVFIAFIAYTTSGAIALYLVVNNLVSAAQEIFIKRKLNKKKAITV